MKTTAVLLTLLAAVMPAGAGIKSRCRRLCRSQILACHAAGNAKASCRQMLMAQCVASGATACEYVPPTTTTTIPSNPFAVFDGAWTYSLSYVGSVGCSTLWPSTIVCTLALTTGTQGGITGVDCAGHAFTGAFTSTTAASLHSSAFADPYGCASGFAADLSAMTANSGTVNVGVAQECTPGMVCTDQYTGTLAR